eukprot:CAMPEP_0201569634 /NCGR_PEP_ID=MMETSP0190_2-20130828/11426_1 /ASSEMBLY_ACC=CAM_ASM_000263 /TAXON_ID=37353 /ORGANISM="Rosalina sp." /LENGTH=133 /DNA_ID=CAMNT_0047992179 /DNA_START=42 /DNA_END=440 /DNA_ORIENTATION=-
MSKPEGLGNIVANGDDTNGTNAHDNGNDNYLDPSKGRLRVASSEDASQDFNSENGSLDYDDGTEHEIQQLTGRGNIQQANSTQTCCQRVRWYLNIAVEGDLAGFQFAWLFMSLGFIILKIFSITDVIDRIQWW